MKTATWIAVFFAPAILWAKEPASYPSLPSEVLSTYTAKQPDSQTGAAMAKAGETFLSLLDEGLRNQAVLPFDSEEKADWTNVPPRGDQAGVRLGDLDEVQLKGACDFLAAILSPQGYGKARNIPLADDRLLRNGERRAGFGAEDYWLVIFGEPSATEPWAVQLDGHHLAINLAFKGEEMEMSPTFIGTQPRDFELNGKRIAPMENMDAAALALIETLTEEQKGKAVVGARRRNLVAGAGKDGFIPKPEGVPCQLFNKAQRTALMEIIRLYVGDLPKPFADKRLKELTDEIDKMYFAWWGPTVAKGDYAYRIQGPTLIIEYAGQNLGRDPRNHLHSIYRDPTNEYGEALGK